MFVYIVLFLVCLLVIYKVYFKLTLGWCRSNVCLVGKTVLITGANSGIGYETACDLAKRGAKVILACKSEDRAIEAVKNIIEETNNENVSYKIVNLGSLKSVRECAKEIIATEDRLDILINNAGMQAPSIRQMNKDGLHPVMAANYFGPFLLTNLLLDLLKKSTPSRIINVSSFCAKSSKFSKLANINAFDSMYQVYSKSKLCNILFTIVLNEKLQSSGVTTYTLHPGAIATKITRQMHLGLKLILDFCLYWMFKTPLEGAQTTIHCAVAKNIEKYSGSLFTDCEVVEMYKTANNPELARGLWSLSEKLVKLEHKS